MAYEKNTWANGDVITAEKLNNIENGIEMTNNEAALPLLVIPGSYGIGDTISGWNTISEYVYRKSAAAMFMLEDFDSGGYFIYVIWNYMGVFCVSGGEDSAPNISISDNGTISAS